jgi:hypothetical protein
MISFVPCSQKSVLDAFVVLLGRLYLFCGYSWPSGYVSLLFSLTFFVPVMESI